MVLADIGGTFFIKKKDIIYNKRSDIS